MSYDVIHLEQAGSRQTHDTIGGAGLYTALAAASTGARVTLFAPRPKGDDKLISEVTRLVRWVGPTISRDRMPRLEIVHHGNDKATLLGAAWGGEEELFPELLPDYIDERFEIAHIAALSSANRQLAFLKELQENDLCNRISVGTYARCIEADRAGVRELTAESDFVFMNANEARLLFGKGSILPRRGQVYFVTDGKFGATIYNTSDSYELSAEESDELDPTGAGDSFCGAALSGLSANRSALDAAKDGISLAARVIEHPGPGHYFS